MKKTKLIFALICVLFFVIDRTQAQTYYYNTTKTFSVSGKSILGIQIEPGYTYQCDKPDHGLVTLYNKENLYTNTITYVYKDGSTITDTKLLRGDIKLIEDDNWTKQQCFFIVNNAFSAAEKQRVKGKKFDVNMTIDTSTGKVIEVEFCFYYSSAFGTIPVSTYRKIELELKKRIWFTLTDAGKSLKFVQRGWMQEVK